MQQGYTHLFCSNIIGFVQIVVNSVPQYFNKMNSEWKILYDIR